MGLGDHLSEPRRQLHFLKHFGKHDHLCHIILKLFSVGNLANQNQYFAEIVKLEFRALVFASNYMEIDYIANGFIR